MPKIGIEKGKKDEPHSFPIIVHRPEGGVQSLWRWLTRKSKHTDLTRKDFDENTRKIKLSSQDIQQLKASGIDIKQLQNQAKYNKKVHTIRIQASILPKEFLKGKEISNDYVPLKIKPEKGLKEDSDMFGITSVNHKGKSTNKIKARTAVVGVKQQKSVVKGLSYRVGMKSNIKLTSHTKLPYRSILQESIPTTIIQSNIQKSKLNSNFSAYKKPESNISHVNRSKSPSNNRSSEDVKIIPKLFEKMKSIEEQLSKIELKTSKFNGAVSKQKDIKSSYARCDLNYNLPTQYTTKNAVSHKIYSKNSYSPTKIKNTKKNKHPLEVLPKADSLASKGYPFEKMYSTLYGISFVQTPMFKESINRKGDNKCENHNVMVFSKSNMDNENIKYSSKMLNNSLEVNSNKIQQQEEPTTGHKEYKMTKENSLSGCSLLSKPNFNWKPRNVSPISEVKIEEHCRVGVEKIDQHKTVLSENKKFDELTFQIKQNSSVKQLNLLKSTNTVLKALDFEPHQDEENVTAKDKNPLEKDNHRENTLSNQIKAVNGVEAGLDEAKTFPVEFITSPHNGNCLVSNNLEELSIAKSSDGLNLLIPTEEDNIPKVSNCMDKFNMGENDSKIFIGQTLLKTSMNDSDLNVDAMPTKNLTSQLSESSEKQICPPLATLNEPENSHLRTATYFPSNGVVKNVRSCYNLSDIPIAYDSLICKGGQNNTGEHLENQDNVLQDTIMPASEDKKETKIEITILVKDRSKVLVTVNSNMTANLKESKDKDYNNVQCTHSNICEHRQNKCVLDKTDYYMKSYNCNSLYEEHNPSRIKIPIELKTQKIGNDLANLEPIETNPPNFLNPSNIFKGSISEFENVGRYLTQKEREYFDKLYVKKRSKFNITDPEVKTNIEMGKEDVTVEDNKFVITKAPNRKDIKENFKNNNDLKQNVELNGAINRSEINAASDIIKNKSIKLTSPITNEREKLSLIKLKEHTDFNFDNSQEKQSFFHVVKESPGENPPAKSNPVDPRKRSFRYGLTLSQEPILVPAEGRSSTECMLSSELQSDKGDNIEINGNEALRNKSDISSMSAEKLNVKNKSSDSSPSNLVESSSVFVQTDLSLADKPVNEVSKQTIFSQTDITMFDYQLHNKNDSCKCSMRDSQTKYVVFQSSTKMKSEENKINISNNFAKNPRPIEIIMRNENVTEVKLSNLFISVISESNEEKNSTNDEVLNLVKTLINDKDSGTFKNAYEKTQVDHKLENQDATSKTDDRIKTIHRCTARCLYSPSQESSLCCTSDLESSITPAENGPEFSVK